MPRPKKPEYRSEPICVRCGRREATHSPTYGRLRSRHTFVPEPMPEEEKK